MVRVILYLKSITNVLYHSESDLYKCYLILRGTSKNLCSVILRNSIHKRKKTNVYIHALTKSGRVGIINIYSHRYISKFLFDKNQKIYYFEGGDCSHSAFVNPWSPSRMLSHLPALG